MQIVLAEWKIYNFLCHGKCCKKILNTITKGRVSMIKKISAIFITFCLSLSLVFLNASHTFAADLGKPEISCSKPIAGESMTVSWKPVAGAYKYYVGIADVTYSSDPSDIYHPKIDKNSEVYGTSYTFGKPKVDFEAGHTYKIADGATADKNGLVEDVVISGNWSWATEIVTIEKSPTVGFNSPQGGSIYRVGDTVDIKAVIEGEIEDSEISSSLVRITHVNSNPVHESSPLISYKTIKTKWNTLDCQEGEYYIEVIVFGRSGNILAEKIISVMLEMSDSANSTPEEAKFGYLKLAYDVNYTDSSVPIVAKIEGSQISDADIIITRVGSDETRSVIKPLINTSLNIITAYWNTIDCEEGEYAIHVIVYGENGNKLIEGETSAKLIRGNSAIINVLSPNNSIIKKYEIDSEILFEADIEGYGFEYTTFTFYSTNDIKLENKKESSKKLHDPNISYTWITSGYEVGEYSLLIQTYDSNNVELACKRINIILEEPKYVDIIPDSENIKEYLVNDEVVYKARFEGRGFLYANFYVRNKSNPSYIVPFTFKQIHNGEDSEFVWDSNGAEPGEYDVWIEVYCYGDDFDKEILNKLEDTIILRELPSAKIVKISPENDNTYSSNDIVSLEAEVEGSGYKYFRYIVNSENDKPVYDTEITSGEITPVQWNTAGCDAGDYIVLAIIFDANENVLDFRTTKITLTDAKKITYGDLDGNGEVNGIDFAYFRKILLGMISAAPSETWFEAADVDGNGEVNSLDFASLRSYVLGIINEFPVEKKY